MMISPLRFISNRIEEYALQVTYRPDTDEGNVIFNLTLVGKEDLPEVLRVLKDAARTGLMASDRVRLADPGEVVGGMEIPAGSGGICTVCSLTLDGLLLKNGIPHRSIGGGIVEIEDRIPRRFIHLILYEHTTIDPLQVLASQDLANISSVMRTGRGSILANIREVHMEAEPQVSQLLDLLSERGFTGILDMGAPNIPLLGVPVSPHYLGIAMVGGTNPVAALKEEGIGATTLALKGVMDIREMRHVEDL